MEVWDNSQEAQKLLQEVNNYSTRHYETTTGLETVVAPPRWKMAIVVFIAAYTIACYRDLLLIHR